MKPWETSPTNRGRILLLIVTSCFSACTNNLSLGTASSTSQQTVVPPTTGTTTSGVLTISRVVKNATTPNKTVDIVGDGTNAMGNICVPSDGSSPLVTTSTTVCNCTFAYNTTLEPNQSIDVPVTYHETNLLRCNYNTLPSDVTSFNLSIHLTSSNSYSNVVNFNLATGGTTLDLTNPTSFTTPIRYQCRDIVNILYSLDSGGSGIYDPFQSEDPHMTYPLDYYATNLYSAVTSYVGAGASSWRCPSVLNPNQYLANSVFPGDSSGLSALQQFTAANYVNLNIYSIGPLSGGGGSMIYPPTAGTFDRSTFYLATQASGIFNVAVNAYIAPNIISVTPPSVPAAAAASPPPLGYGVTPTPIGTAGSGQETCPDTSVAIPPNYHWVKVWLFRAGLAQRHFTTSNDITKLQSISCNPGDWPSTEGTATNIINQPIFSGCEASLSDPTPISSPTPGTSIALNDVGSTAHPTLTLADRVLGGVGQQCVHLQKTGTASCSAGNPGASCTDGVNNDDLWEVLIPNASLYPQSASIGCSATATVAAPADDVLNICGSLTSPVHPTTYNLTTVDYDLTALQPNARYDFLFVVTPTSVMTENMLDTSSSSTSLPYQPYRFYTNLDCLSPDPNAAAAGDCLPQNIISYGIKFHDVGTNGDPGSSDPTNPSAGVFPVCALQPNL